MKNEMALPPLKRWLRKNNLKMGEFAEIIGCHVQTLQSVNKQKGIDSTIANKIFFATSGEIEPVVKRRGRPSCEHFHIAP